MQSANGNATVQNSQAENLLTQGVDVLVVIPNNAKTAATIVESAHKANVPVIAYDRLILDSDVDLYVSFDTTRVGELQAEYLVSKQAQGQLRAHRRRAHRQQRAPRARGPDEGPEAAHRQGRHQDRGRPVGDRLAARRGPEDHGERAHPQPQPGGRGPGLERRHRGRCHPGPERAEALRQGRGLRSGRRPRRLASASWPAPRP